MNDTPPEIWAIMNELIAKKTSAERFKMGSSMHATSRHLIILALLKDNPEISEADLKKALFLKFYQEDFPAEERERILQAIEERSSKEQYRKNPYLNYRSTY